MLDNRRRQFKCIDNHDYRDELTIGKIYAGFILGDMSIEPRIVRITRDTGIEGDFYMRRFVDVTPRDPEEEVKLEKQELMAFFAAVPANHCKCGILQDLCHYHRPRY